MARSMRFFARRILGLSVVRGFDIAITYDCNLQCEHCNVTAVHDSERSLLSIGEIADAVRQLRKIGGFYVTFTGGEVLTKLDYLEEIVQRINPRSMLLQVQTNGVLLNETSCERLKMMGIDNLHISFDDCHETDDWDRLLEIKKQQLDMARRWGFYVIFIALASHKTIHDTNFKRIIEFAEANNVSIGLNFAVSQGRWDGNEDILLTDQDSLEVRRLSQEHDNIFTDLDSNLIQYGCPAFSERFYINGYGDVQPCTFFQVGFGNVREEPLCDIWKRGLANSLFAGFPDHCPPAENGEYIRRWQRKRGNARRIPISESDFFDHGEIPTSRKTGHPEGR
jgi:MoaA/NifB/PqqE/SkfB family radical SAM enzyme